MLSDIWSMFSNNFRYSTTKTGKYVKELQVSELPLTENRVQKLLLVRFLLLLLFRQMVENCAFFLGQIAISQPVLKIRS